MDNFSSIESDFVFPQRLTLFEQVSKTLAEMISHGKWAPGEMLPNEIELARSFNVSQGTMRRALNLLVEKGALIRRQGKGTFVAEMRTNEAHFQKRYIKLVPDDPEKDERVPTTSKLLFFDRVVAPLEIQKILKQTSEDLVVHTARALLASSGLVTFDEIWARGKEFEKLTEENLLNHKEKLLYSFYQTELGVSIGRCEETIKAALLPPNLCYMFSLPSPTPVIEVRRIAYTVNDEPVEYHRQLSITEKYHYAPMPED